MPAFFLDLRLAARSLRKTPGFTATTVATLALVIAATTTIVAVVDTAIIRPLPFPNPDRLVRVWERTPEGADFSASELNYLDFSKAQSLSGLGGFRDAQATLTLAGDAHRVHGVAASRSLFDVLGVRPALGRGFLETEDVIGNHANVVLLSHAFWQARFASDSSIVGQTVSLNGAPNTVIGVMPATLHFPDADLYIPLHAGANTNRTDHWLTLVGRLRGTATMEQASAELVGIAQQLGAAYPTSSGWSVRVASLFDALVDPNFRRAGWVLLAATGLLLLLGCANVANLMFARATTRRAEMGVRAALGAGRGRLVRHELAEAVVIVALATVAGLTTSVWAADAVRVVGAGRIPRLETLTIDARIMAATVVVALLTVLACGLAPALSASRTDPAAVLSSSARTGASRRHRRLRNGLVMAQVTVSVVLLVGAGLLMRTFASLATASLGFDAEHVLSVNLDLPESRYDESQQSIFHIRLMERLRALPGVEAAGATAVDPLSGWNFMNDVTPEERAATTPAAGFMQAAWRSVTPEFFAAMGMTTLTGRVFRADDVWNGPRIAVISRSLATQLWPNADPVGKRLLWGNTTGRAWTIIGVVNDVRDVAPQATPTPTLYLPNNQIPMPSMTVIVRTTGRPAALESAVRGTIHDLDATLPVDDIHPLSRNRVDAMTGPRFNLVLMMAFAFLAVLLAASGVIAVVAFDVAERRRDIGIRLALGASPNGVVSFFLRSGLGPIGAGLLVGLGVAALASGAMRGLLYGVEPTDPLTYAIALALLGAVGLLASWLPARRAARVAPMDALRST